MTDTTTRLTGLTWAQVHEVQACCQRLGIVPITGATTATVPLSAGRLLAELQDHKTIILGTLPDFNRETGETRRGRATAASSVIRKLKRYLEPTPDQKNWDRLLGTGGGAAS